MMIDDASSATVPSAEQAPPRPRRATHLRLAVWGLVVAALIAIPYLVSHRAVAGYVIPEALLLGTSLPELNVILVTVIGAVALNLIVGRAGLLSVGHAAFFAVGAATASVTGTHWHWPFLVTLVAAGAMGALVGVVIGLPSLRLRGLYLMLATLALHYIAIYLFLRYQLASAGPSGLTYGNPAIFGWQVDSDVRWYFVLIVLITLVLVALRNLDRSRVGQAFVAVRDHPYAAASLGMNPAVIRLQAFGASSFLVAVSGALYAFFVGIVNADSFTFAFIVGYFAMVLLGGIGSMPGAVAGALVWGFLPALLRLSSDYVDPGTPVLGNALSTYQSQSIAIVTGIAIIMILRFQPDGLAGLGRWIARKAMGGRDDR
jgi:branched-chain amino acid transport system permease protein